MPAKTSTQRPPDSCEGIVAQVLARRLMMSGPGGLDPVLSPALGPEDDAVEMCAAVYALPAAYRELNRSGIPLMWAWPSSLYEPRARRDELIEAMAMMLVAVERVDSGGGRIQLRLVGSVVGQNR